MRIRTRLVGVLVIWGVASMLQVQGRMTLARLFAVLLIGGAFLLARWLR